MSAKQPYSEIRPGSWLIGSLFADAIVSPELVETFVANCLDGRIATRVVTAPEADRLFVVGRWIIPTILAGSVDP
jgi:hypothetical protein